jgi:hypothetical protein
MSFPKDGAPGPQDGDTYLWWNQGLADEAAARDEGLSPQAIELRDCLEALAKFNALRSAEDLLTALARIYHPHILKRRYRR